jgi:prepilin-type N-terminal cleavage/methylation domain-containing protein
MRRIVLDQREDGFTLVELVVAMLIIGVVLVSVATVQVGTLQTNADNAARNTASALANGAMEQFRSIPWNVLRKGMASNYLTASGGDSLVSGGVLTPVAGGLKHYSIVVAPGGASDQDLTNARLPLFDTTGSHTQVIVDPEGNGNTYRVKAYVVTDTAAGADGAVGLAVVVEWERPGSAVVHRTSMFSAAYAPVGGCGNLDNAPFLTSCQPQYVSWANTASTSVLVSASEYDTATGDVGAALPVVPGTDSGGINTAGSRARAASDSAQSTSVSANVEFAVSSVSPLDGTDTATLVGGDFLSVQASNNTALPHPLPGAAFNGYGGDAKTAILSSGNESVWIYGDFGREGHVTATTSSTCTTGPGTVPAGQPCAAAWVSQGPWTTPLGATWKRFDGARDLQLVTSNNSAAQRSYAWTGRYQLGHAAGPGCSALSGAGCVSAGAQSYVQTLRVGQMGGTGWIDSSGDPGPAQLVSVSGYADTVLVQRGAAQSATPATITRLGTISYWNGTGYTPVNVSVSPQGVYTTPQVFYDGANVTLTASATIAVSPPSQKVSGSECEKDRCRVQADAGLISVTLKIIVEPASGTPYLLEALLLINGSTGLAEYTEPVDA